MEVVHFGQCLHHSHDCGIHPRKFKEGICCGGHLAVTSGTPVWRRVIVPPDFFVAKPAIKCKLPLPRGLTSRKHNGYRSVNHAVTIMCADRTEYSRQIWRHNKFSPGYIRGGQWQCDRRPIVLTLGSKRDPIPPFKLLGYIRQVIIYQQTGSAGAKKTDPSSCLVCVSCRLAQVAVTE